MKIAIIGSIWISTPPAGFGFGAQEYLIYYLAEYLRRKGHDVTLFATADSQVNVRLISVSDRQVEDITFPDNRIKDMFELMNVSKAYTMASEFDVIHNHLLPYGLLFTELTKTPTLHTLHHAIYHNRADIFLYRRFQQQNFVSISNKQRTIVPELNYRATVYNGVDSNFYQFKQKPEGNYLLYLGRMKRYKGIHHAIALSRKLTIPLKIVSPLPIPTQPDYAEVMHYWQEEIKPYIDGDLITHSDNVQGQEKLSFIQNAKALIFPIEREEPFGMTVIEAMSCGTPVIAFANGAIPEMIVNEKMGYLINPPDFPGLLTATKKLYAMQPDVYTQMRHNARKQVQDNFTIEKMVEGYEKLYQELA